MGMKENPPSRLPRLTSAFCALALLLVVASPGRAYAGETTYWDGPSASGVGHNYGQIATTGGFVQDKDAASDYVRVRTLNYDYIPIHSAWSPYWFVEMTHITRWNHYAHCSQTDSYAGDPRIWCVAKTP